MDLVGTVDHVDQTDHVDNVASADESINPSFQILLTLLLTRLN